VCVCVCVYVCGCVCVCVCVWVVGFLRSLEPLRLLYSCVLVFS
jgi:hypothetical protein